MKDASRAVGKIALVFAILLVGLIVADLIARESLATSLLLQDPSITAQAAAGAADYRRDLVLSSAERNGDTLAATLILLNYIWCGGVLAIGTLVLAMAGAVALAMHFLVSDARQLHHS